MNDHHLAIIVLSVVFIAALAVVVLHSLPPSKVLLNNNLSQTVPHEAPVTSAGSQAAPTFSAIDQEPSGTLFSDTQSMKFTGWFPYVNFQRFGVTFMYPGAPFVAGEGQSGFVHFTLSRNFALTVEAYPVDQDDLNEWLNTPNGDDPPLYPTNYEFITGLA